MSVASSISLPKLRLSPKKVISPQIYDFLRKHITETTIKPGTLLSENSLSAHFHVSRQPVREALMRLSYEGLLSVLPQRGSVVERIDVRELFQIVFVRTAIEKECILNSVRLDPKIRRNIFKQMEKVLEKQRQCKHDDNVRGNYLYLDDLFHEKICALSGTPLAWRTIQSIKGQMDRIRFLGNSISDPIDTYTDEHEEIYLALKEGDLEISIAHLTAHLRNILENHKKVMSEYRDWFTPESLATLDNANYQKAIDLSADDEELN